MAGGYGPLDLKTKTGRLILVDKIQKKSTMAVKITWSRFIKETLFSINIKFPCGNYHNLLNPSHWKCKCK